MINDGWRMRYKGVAAYPTAPCSPFHVVADTDRLVDHLLSAKRATTVKCCQRDHPNERTAHPRQAMGSVGPPCCRWRKNRRSRHATRR